MKFKIGSTKIRIQATDLAGNIQKCQFSITVLGNTDTVSTVWKIQILREINFGGFRSSKSAISAFQEALNFDSDEFWHFLRAETDQN